MFEPYLEGDLFFYAQRYLFGASRRPTTLFLGGVHPSDACEGRSCVIHNPSDHCMRSWPLNWRHDRMIFERMCEHGVGHPDPDSLYYEEHQADLEGDCQHQHVGVHGCDGCCRPPCGVPRTTK